MRVSQVVAIILSGLLWLGIGVMLLIKGLKFVVHAGSDSVLLNKLAPYLGSYDQAVVFLVAIGLFAGFLKGRMVLIKAVRKVVKRVASLPAPIKINQIYDQRYYVLMAFMMSLGLLLNVLNVPSDVRGTIDIAIGAALMNGAMAFFRTALSFKQEYS